MANWIASIGFILLATLAAFFVVCAIGVAFLFVVFSPSRVVTSRAPSPSGQYVATLVEVNGGATTAFGCNVLLSRPSWGISNIEVASLYAAGRCGSGNGVYLHWASDERLQIDYVEAQNAKAGTPWWARPLLHVNVVLQPGVSHQPAHSQIPPHHLRSPLSAGS